MSKKSNGEEEFVERVCTSHLGFDTALKRARLRAENWKAGAAIFGAGTAFSAALISVFHFVGH